VGALVVEAGCRKGRRCATKPPGAKSTIRLQVPSPGFHTMAFAECGACPSSSRRRTHLGQRQCPRRRQWSGSRPSLVLSPRRRRSGCPQETRAWRSGPTWCTVLEAPAPAHRIGHRLDLERHCGLTPGGVFTRVLQQPLALTTATLAWPRCDRSSPNTLRTAWN
jgi:hypothetical protein